MINPIYSKALNIIDNTPTAEIDAVKISVNHYPEVIKAALESRFGEVSYIKSVKGTSYNFDSHNIKLIPCKFGYSMIIAQPDADWIELISMLNEIHKHVHERKWYLHSVELCFDYDIKSKSMAVAKDYLLAMGALAMPQNTHRRSGIHVSYGKIQKTYNGDINGTDAVLFGNEKDTQFSKPSSCFSKLYMKKKHKNDTWSIRYEVELAKGALKKRLIGTNPYNIAEQLHKLKQCPLSEFIAFQRFNLDSFKDELKVVLTKKNRFQRPNHFYHATASTIQQAYPYEQQRLLPQGPKHCKTTQQSTAQGGGKKGSYQCHSTANAHLYLAMQKSNGGKFEKITAA